MRRFCLIVLAVSMIHIGCQSRNQDRRGGADNNRPIVDRNKGGNFWDDNPSPSPKTASAPIDPRFGLPNPNESELDGVLAGRIVDSYDRAPGTAFIRVTLVDPNNPTAAPKEIGVTPNAEGYFVIQGLKPRKTYSLSAQAKDGERVLAGVVQAQPPYTRLLIRVSEDKVSSMNAGPVPGPVGSDSPFNPPPPAKSPNAEQKSPPPAAIPRPSQGGPPEPDPIPMGPGNAEPAPPPESPTRVNPSPAGAIPRDPNDGSWTPGPRGPLPAEDDLPPSRTPASEPPRFESIADGPARARDPNLNIPNPKRPPPRAEPPSRYAPSIDDQSMNAIPNGPPPQAARPSEVQPASSIEPAPTRTVARTLNFTVYDPQGQAWDFQDHSGRLVLVDFWSTTCRPCLASMPDIKRLTSRYGAAGLEVVGIALEDGPWQQKAGRVAEIHRSKQLNYRVFLENGSSSNLQRMFNVRAVPTLILLDGEGKELWRGHGQQIPQLEAVLQRELSKRQ